jgi:glucose/arabinose dehydrogenase
MKMTRPLAASAAMLLIASIAPLAPGQTLSSQPVVTSGLSAPLWCGHAPGDQNRLFIAEQRRGISIADLAPNGSGTLRAARFLDLTQASLSSLLGANGLEYGILGVAFHPNYASNGYFYISCTPTTQSGGANDYAVVRFQVDPNNPNIANPASKQVVIRVVYPIANHRSGWLEFGPDGYLYFTTGDGGEGDPGNVASNKAIPRGKILRIDVDGADNIPGNADDDGFPPTTDEKNYTIPASNPFLGEAGAVPEMWAYGLRNAWRASFDRGTGDLWVGDVGQVTREEITWLPAGAGGVGAGAGAFLGWRCLEGTFQTGYAGCMYPIPAATPPIYEYPRSCTTGNCPILGNSVTGGVVYRGCSMPNLRGHYFFGDWNGSMVSAVRSGNTLTNFVNRRAETGLTGTIVHFGQDPQGELYIVFWGTNTGSIHKLKPSTLQGPDCNANLQNDSCDIAKGVSQDLNHDGVPDECQGFPCTSDFNHDGDFGTDADIEAFFACLGGNCCAACSSADFNADGDFGTDQDIEAFFRVLAGAPC